MYRVHQLSFKFTQYLNIRLIQHLYFYINVTEIIEVECNMNIRKYCKGRKRW